MTIFHRVHGHAKRHYQKHYVAQYSSRAHFVFMLDAFLVSCALALLALGAYFGWYYHPLRDTFRLTVTSIGEVVGGQKTEVGVLIQNLGKETLTHAHLSVYLPKNFIADDDKNGVRDLEIAQLPPDTPIDYRFRGFPVGVPQTEKIVVRFNASDPRGKTDEKLEETALRWDHSLIEMNFLVSSAVVPGQNTVFRLHVKNGSSLPFSDVSVMPTWPPGFQLIRSTPPFYRGTLAFGDLSPGEEADLEFSGRFGSSTDLQRFKAELTGTLGDQSFTLATAQDDVKLVNAGMNLEAVFSEPAPAFVQAKQEIPVTIRYRNDGDRSIMHLVLSLKPDPSSIASIRWDDESAIDELKPGASGERTAHILLRDMISQYAVNPMLQAIPQADFDVADSDLKDVEIVGTAASTKIVGDATLRTAARYFTSEGDQIGRGPLPPKVGKATSYWILASLETGASQIDNGSVVFRLPRGVDWTGRSAVTAGDDLQRDGDGLIWRLGATEAHAGVAFESPSASFEVSLTPTAEQVGMTPDLLNSSVFKGIDAWTGVALTSSLGGLDSQLPGDPKVRGRTKVVR